MFSQSIGWEFVKIQGVRLQWWRGLQSVNDLVIQIHKVAHLHSNVLCQGQNNFPGQEILYEKWQDFNMEFNVKIQGSGKVFLLII